MLDSMAKRYGMLPSQVLKEATTQDVYVFDMALSYERYAREKQEKESQAHSRHPLRTMDQVHNQQSDKMSSKELEKRFTEWKKQNA